MKLTVLVDNNTLIDKYFVAEPGLSFYIEDEGKKILFDLGYSGIFIENALKMSVDLKHIDNLVFSHGHLDHTWGLSSYIKYINDLVFENKNFKKPEIIAHPQAFDSKIHEEKGEVGSLISKDKLAKFFSLNLSDKPYWITNKLVFLGEIPRVTDFEGKCTSKVMISEDQHDCLLDDTALVYDSSQGLVIITGCSHSGICNIIEYTKSLFPDKPIFDVIGGFHMLGTGKSQMQLILDYFKKQNITRIHPCHCTDLAAKIAFSEVVKVKEVGVGLVLEYF